MRVETKDSEAIELHRICGCTLTCSPLRVTMALASFLSTGRTLSRHCRVPYSGLSRRFISSKPSLRRSWIYVPSSSERMLQKSLGTGSDVIIYDLEDSVSPAAQDKENARNRLHNFLQVLTFSYTESSVNKIFREPIFHTQEESLSE